MVVISSDDDSGKSAESSPPDAKIKTEEPEESSSTADLSNEKPESPSDETKENRETDDIKKESSDEIMSESKKQTVDKNDNKPVKSPGSPDDCISQEDLLARLGLGSVKSISNTKPKKEEKVSNGVLTERRPLIPHKPKESIVDLLRAPKLKNHEEKAKTNGETPVTVLNGVSDDDDSAPGTRTPSEVDEDDELLAKEQLIEELRQELRNEEAKLLLLKKIQAAQNDPKATIKYTKEKENEKILSTVQFVKSTSTQLTTKKNQLPPPPPLKAHISTTGTYQPPVAIQPKILPKVTNVQSLHISKQISQSQGSKSARSGSSAIKDLQNVISSMSTNLIHPTPMYPRSGSQGGAVVYTTHSQNPPVRPTPVRANNPPSGSSGSSYSSFPAHISSKSSSASPITAAGKQAAAKMALRKQLEKTLLQIPPPKPPPAEWSFIPNLNSAEFMALVGFEKVVDSISEKEQARKGKTVPLIEKSESDNLKICGQCSTDFTPCWKARNKEGTDVLMCEKCSTVNVKKELKTEHTARLKAAFLKALKQEQEIEQKMSETTPIAPKPQSSSKTSSHQSSSNSSSHHHVSHHQGVHHGSHRHRHVQGIYHHHQPHSDSLLFQLQQQHMQQQQQEMEVAARRHGDVRWHPYMPGHHHSSSHKSQHHHTTLVSESDRQYLLDMIPSLPAQSLNYSSSRI